MIIRVYYTLFWVFFLSQQTHLPSKHFVIHHKTAHRSSKSETATLKILKLVAREEYRASVIYWQGIWAWDHLNLGHILFVLPCNTVHRVHDVMHMGWIPPPRFSTQTFHIISARYFIKKLTVACVANEQGPDPADTWVRLGRIALLDGDKAISLAESSVS